MKRIVFDIETDGFLDKCTKIHSLVLMDVDTGEMISRYGQGFKGIDNALAWLDSADQIIGHNILHFDLPAIAKITGDPSWLPSWQDVEEGRIIDTAPLWKS